MTTPLPSNIDIRPATDDDLFTVKAILQEDLAHHVRASGGDSQTLTVEFLRQTLSASTMLVVDHGDDLLGYLQYQVRPPKIVVNGAAIGAAYQGQGLGTRLLARALTDAAHLGCDTVEISVQPTNVAVWEMYRRYGFQERPGGSDWNRPLVHDLSTVRQLVAQKLGAS